MKQLIFIFLFVSINNANTRGVAITKGDSETWKTDSLSCLGRRKPIFLKILKAKASFIGMPESLIKYYLGNPNVVQKLTNSKRYYYFVERGPQCMYVNKSGYDTISVEELYISFNKKQRVTELRGMNP